MIAWVIIGVWLFTMVILFIGYDWWSDRDLWRVWVYTLAGFGVSESNKTVYFQFRALTDVIRLILPFWCSFSSQIDIFEQGDVSVGSPRALYGHRGVQPLVCTIVPLSQRAWRAQFDNTGTLGRYWGKEMAWGESQWWEWCLPHLLQQFQHFMGFAPIFG